MSYLDKMYYYMDGESYHDSGYQCDETLRYQYAEVTDDKWNSLVNMSCAEKQCLLESWTQPPDGEGKTKYIVSIVYAV